MPMMRKVSKLDEQCITDEDIEKAEQMLEVERVIHEQLKKLPPDRRIPVLRAASILSTGKDLCELGYD